MGNTAMQKHRVTVLTAIFASMFWLGGGCGSTAPFPMTRVTGTVTYDDGTAIPGNRVTVTFIPQVPPVDERTHPRSAYATVDPETGELGAVTTSKYDDGLIRGEHKVTIVAVDQRDNLLPSVDSIYSSEKTTPLLIHTDDSPLEIKIPKP